MRNITVGESSPPPKLSPDCKTIPEYSLASHAPPPCKCDAALGYSAKVLLSGKVAGASPTPLQEFGEAAMDETAMHFQKFGEGH